MGYVGVLLVLAGVAYFLPAFVAALRHHPNANAIAALDLLAGWTLIGWIVAMVWALTSTGRTAAIRKGN